MILEDSCGFLRILEIKKEERTAGDYQLGPGHNDAHIIEGRTLVGAVIGVRNIPQRQITAGVKRRPR